MRMTSQPYSPQHPPYPPHPPLRSWALVKWTKGTTDAHRGHLSRRARRSRNSAGSAHSIRIHPMGGARPKGLRISLETTGRQAISASSSDPANKRCQNFAHAISTYWRWKSVEIAYKPRLIHSKRTIWYCHNKCINILKWQLLIRKVSLSLIYYESVQSTLHCDKLKYVLCKNCCAGAYVIVSWRLFKLRGLDPITQNIRNSYTLVWFN